ncbi:MULTISPECIES: type II toxin-antitoxin system PemK/MazF family toxin [Acetobacteraceae]|uniref:type II toxin-antitoxin system PemK/MazF family toxin n=1 Tax=Acetobacteraceae TaxID=433 RepID=UPI000A3CFB37|nr:MULTISPECIES: type II toxin-antitoxin system PemK/MazF family toxin [Acetobacteraceae]MCL1563563.1 type II toxin-antitoxin system PemK/MazF family toxin [Parasaccharibacter sp. TMW 2.1886]MCL1513637.1 type II toxin-antitoxin system PemK/MazF family toxin [Parasaccharibacter sp. TMW 2.1891]MCL1515248.1 type II toxin-antitoxin system PemK/MazF family toxin [Parasaccharibacter sp. TMW2.1890]MCT6814459.1 type II toxin-antitoxin system PemK/MazF family toxin [Bombella apis]MUG90466.1 type II tox
MRRGDLVTVALQGDLGKPRPALIIQADSYHETASVVILPVTSTIQDAPLLRLTVEPDGVNGLKKMSSIMIDKPSTIQRGKVGPAFGRLHDYQMVEITRLLAVFLGMA